MIRNRSKSCENRGHAAMKTALNTHSLSAALWLCVVAAVALLIPWRGPVAAEPAQEQAAEPAAPGQEPLEPGAVSPEAYAHFCTALSKMRSGDGRGALAELEQTVKLDPGAHRAWYHLASLQKGQGKLAEARQCLEQAVKLAPKEFRYHFELGRVLLLLNRFDEGIDSLEAAANLTEGRRAAIIYQQVGKYHLRRGEPEKAIEAYGKAMKASEEPLEIAKKLLALQEKQGDWEGAVETYRYLLEHNPEFTAALLKIAQVYQKAGKWDEAVGAYDEYLAAGPKLLEECAALSWARKAALKAGKPDKAQAYLAKLAEAFGRVLKEGEADSRLYAQLAALFNDAGEIQRAIDILEAGLEQATPPAAVEIHKTLADIYIQEAIPGKAEAELAAALDLNPDSAALHARMAVLRLDMCEYEAAALEIRKAMKLSDGPERLQYNGTLASIYSRMRRYDKAEAELEAVVEAQPNIARAWAMLGDLRRKAGRLEQAAEALRRALDLGSTDKLIQARWRLELVEVYQQLGQEDNARQEREVINNLAEDAGTAFSIAYLLYQQRHYEHSLEVIRSKLDDKTPDELKPPARALIAWVLQALGKPDDAVKEMQKSIDESPGKAGPYREMAGLLVKQARYNEALELLNKAIDLQPDEDEDMMVRLSKADLLGEMGRLEEARRCYQQIHDEHPEDPTVNNNFSYFLAVHNRDLDSALEMVKKALAQEPESAAYLDTFGWVLYRKGDYKGALLKINQAYTRQQDAVIAEHLGDVLAKLGRHQQALDAYREGLERDPDSENLAEKVKKMTELLKLPQEE